MKTHFSDFFHPRSLRDMLGYRGRQGERTGSWMVTGGFLGIDMVGAGLLMSVPAVDRGCK